MAQHVYEGLFILDSNRYARDPAGAAGQLTELVQRLGGETLASRLWEDRRLAYPIKGQRKGTYWLIYFRLDAGQIPPLKHELGLNEMVLRSLLLKVDPRIVDALVSHALSGGVVRRAPEMVTVGAGVAVAVDDDVEIEEI